MHLAAVGGSAGWAIAGWTAGGLVFLAVVAFFAVAYRTHLADKVHLSLMCTLMF
jgi:hypothetical protein